MPQVFQNMDKELQPIGNYQPNMALTKHLMNATGVGNSGS
jgi:hypothetical protein